MTTVPAAPYSAPAAPAESRVPMPRGRRRSELLLLLFAIVVVALADACTGLGLNGKIPPTLPEYIGLFALLMLGAHLAVRRWAPWADPLMLPSHHGRAPTLSTPPRWHTAPSA